MTGFFADQLDRECRRVGSPLCVGLDPHRNLLPEWLELRGSRDAVATALADWCRCVIDAVRPHAALVKPQSAHFEQFGVAGAIALERAAEYARACGLIVLLDAKRGDIGSTSKAYATAYLSADEDAALPVDAMTMSPYLGGDSLEPFASASQASGKGVFVCVFTSNPGRCDIQMLETESGPVYREVALMVRAADDNFGVIGSSGLSQIGAVVGSTGPGLAIELREVLPRSVFLLPGLGAQGGKLDGLADARTGGFGGLVVSSSRSITFPDGVARDWNTLGSKISRLARAHADALIEGGLGC